MLRRAATLLVRYGRSSAALDAFARGFVRNVYARWPGWGAPKGVIDYRPSFANDIAKDKRRPYDACELGRSWLALLDVVAGDGALAGVETMRYDVTDIGRQVLSDLAVGAYVRIRSAFAERNSTALHASARLLLQLITDLDALLGTSEHFLFGAWLARARSWAATAEEERAYDFNAVNLVTLWGPQGEWTDYAGKQWAGLVGEYYYKRWSVFVEHLLIGEQAGWAFKEDRFFLDALNPYERSFQRNHPRFPTTPSGDLFRVTDLVRQSYFGKDRVFASLCGLASADLPN